MINKKAVGPQEVKVKESKPNSHASNRVVPEGVPSSNPQELTRELSAAEIRGRQAVNTSIRLIKGSFERVESVASPAATLADIIVGIVPGVGALASGVAQGAALALGRGSINRKAERVSKSEAKIKNNQESGKLTESKCDICHVGVCVAKERTCGVF